MADEVRMIDANSLCAKIVQSIHDAEEWINEAKEQQDTHGLRCATEAKTSLLAMLARIHDEPTIEAEPVKHGCWVRGENKGFPEKLSMIWYCSVCGERIRYNDTLRKYQKIKKSVSQINPRCRNCGARMDGDSE